MRVTELWRYPVKSMLGEALDTADVGPSGVVGDRRWAVVDAQTGVSLSAKRYAVLLDCRARTVDGQVAIALPDGTMGSAASPAIARNLSELLGRDVALKSAGPEHSVKHEFPGDTVAGTGDPFIRETGMEAFFDRAPLHMITTSTLVRLAESSPDSRFDPARFRPNFVVQTQPAGFVEDEWVGRRMAIGSLECEVLARKPRCVITNHQQGSLPKDREIIRTAFRLNEGNVGVELAANATARVGVGDLVVVGQ